MSRDSMQGEAEFDQIVVGGGVVGLVAALALARAGRSVALLSDRPAPLWHKDALPSRVSTLNRASVDVLAVLDAWPVPRAHAFTSMRVWDARSDAEIGFAGQASDDDVQSNVRGTVLGYTVEHAALEAGLWDAAAAAGVALYSQARWMHLDEEPDAVALLVRMSSADPAMATDASKGATSLAMTRLRARWLLAADGARSPLRDRLGIAVSERDYAMRGIVATFEPEKPHDDCARQRFDGDDVVALLPLSGGRVSLVWSCSVDTADALRTLDDAAFAEAVSRASGRALGALRMLGPRAAWPLVGRHARRYGAGRVLLLGDAAHTIHPLAGQGLNLGIADAQSLARLLSPAAGAVSGTAASDRARPEDILRRYEAGRRAGNATMLHAMEAFHALFSSEQEIVRQLRAHGVRAVDRSPWWKRRFAAHAAGESGLL